MYSSDRMKTLIRLFKDNDKNIVFRDWQMHFYNIQSVLTNSTVGRSFYVKVSLKAVYYPRPSSQCSSMTWCQILHITIHPVTQEASQTHQDWYTHSERRRPSHLPWCNFRQEADMEDDVRGKCKPDINASFNNNKDFH